MMKAALQRTGGIRRRVTGLFAMGLLVALMGGQCPNNMPPPNGGGAKVAGTVDQVTGPRLLAIEDSERLENGLVVGGIGTYRRDATLTGEVKPAMFLVDDQSCLGLIRGAAVNSAGELVVLNVDGPCTNVSKYSVNIYADATRINGGQMPVRRAFLADAGGAGGEGLTMALDAANDVLYVASVKFENQARRTRVLVYPGTTQASFNGPITPTKAMLVPGGADAVPISLAVDGTGRLCIGTQKGLIVVASPGTVDGDLDAGEYTTLTNLYAHHTAASGANVYHYHRTQNDNANGAEIERYSGGGASLKRTLTNFPTGWTIAVDSSNTLFVRNELEIRVYENLDGSAAGATVPATRTAKVDSEAIAVVD